MMFIRDLNDCEEITAGDNTLLKVILHPDHEKLNISYSMAYARVQPGETSYLHLLSTSEVYFVLQGEGIMQINDEKQSIKKHQTVFIPPNAKQCVTCTGNEELIFLCIVDPAWKEENEVIF